MCGRLRCCLIYEYEQYVEARKQLPKRNKRVGTPHGEGKVIDVFPLRDAVTVLGRGQPALRRRVRKSSRWKNGKRSKPKPKRAAPSRRAGPVIVARMGRRPTTPSPLTKLTKHSRRTRPVSLRTRIAPRVRFRTRGTNDRLGARRVSSNPRVATARSALAAVGRKSRVRIKDNKDKLTLMSDRPDDILCRRVMGIFAHPDDPEFFCGGTFAKWAAEGREITFVLATSGDKGSADLDYDLGTSGGNPRGGRTRRRGAPGRA